MALLEHELAQARFQCNLVLAAILEAAERERQRVREEKDAGGCGSGSFADTFSASTRLSGPFPSC